MSERLRALRRIEAVQQRLRDRAAYALAAAEREAAAAAGARAALEAYVAETLPTGRLAEVAGRTARTLAERDAEAARRRALAAGAARAAESRLKLVGTLAEDLGREEADKAERKRLELLVEAMLARPPAAGG